MRFFLNKIKSVLASKRKRWQVVTLGVIMSVCAIGVLCYVLAPRFVQYLPYASKTVIQLFGINATKVATKMSDMVGAYESWEDYDDGLDDAVLEELAKKRSKLPLMELFESWKNCKDPLWRDNVKRDGEALLVVSCKTTSYQDFFDRIKDDIFVYDDNLSKYENKLKELQIHRVMSIDKHYLSFVFAHVDDSFDKVKLKFIHNSYYWADKTTYSETKYDPKIIALWWEYIHKDRGESIKASPNTTKAVWEYKIIENLYLKGKNSGR